MPAKHNVRLKATRQKLQSDEAAFYVYETNEDGFILVAADDRARPVLGYAHHGKYDEAKMPENMISWLDYLTAQISHLPDYIAAPAYHEATSPSIAPLMDIEWAQDEPFNRSCPILGSQRCVAGCIATATAEIMRYWQYPTTGRGTHSYKWNEVTRSTDFSEHTYNWSLMPKKYISGSYTEDQANEVAKLFYDIGVGCEMDYGTGGSSSNETMAARALVNYFDYDSAMHIIHMDYIGVQAFEQQIIQELQASRPVMMGGTTPGNAGHAFVCDGVKANGFFHINWGWDGWYNGDFLLTALYPEGQGIGGGKQGDGYTEDVRALVGIQPFAGNGSRREITVEMMGLSTEKNGLKRSESFGVDWATFSNSGIYDWKGYAGLVICDDNWNILSEFSVIQQVLSLDIFHYYPKLSTVAKIVDSTLPAGTYHLLSVYTQTPQSQQWSPVLYQNGSYAYIDITLTTDSVFFAQDEYLTHLQAEDLGNECMRFSWQASKPAAKYVVNVHNGNEKQGLLSTDTVTTTEAVVRFYVPGKYKWCWSVQALDATNKVLSKKNGDDIVVNVTTDYTPSNLKHQVTNKGVLFSWDGSAPAYQIEVKFNGQLIIRQFPKENQYLLEKKTNGAYEWNIRSMSACQNFYISEAVSQSFNLPDATGIDQTETTTNQGKYLQDGQIIIIKNGKQYDITGEELYGRHE